MKVLLQFVVMKFTFMTINAKLAIILSRAMVLNHEQDAPPVRTLFNKECFTKSVCFLCAEE